MRYFLQMLKWIYVILLSLYLEMIKYIRKVKTYLCKPDFEKALLDRSRDWTLSAPSLLLTGQII